MQTKRKTLGITLALSCGILLLALVGWASSRARQPATKTPGLNENPLPEVAMNALAEAADGNLQGFHRVQKGDTLYGIARKHGVSVSAIKEANRDKNDMLAVGEFLVIPGKK